jgi:hypothetical protein
MNLNNQRMGSSVVDTKTLGCRDILKSAQGNEGTWPAGACVADPAGLSYSPKKSVQSKILRPAAA